METQYSKGQRVMITHRSNYGQLGIIKYMGPLTGQVGTYFGVELDTATGKNDGSNNGKQYFICKPNHGVFLKENHFAIYKEGMEKIPIEEFEKSQQKLGTTTNSTTNRTGQGTVKKIPITQQMQSKIGKQQQFSQSIVESGSNNQQKDEKKQEVIVPKKLEVIKQESSNISTVSTVIQKEDGITKTELRDQIDKYLQEIQKKDTKLYEAQSFTDSLNYRIQDLQKKNQELELKVQQMIQLGEEQAKVDNTKELQELQQKLKMFMRKNQQLEEDLKKQQHNNHNIKSDKLIEKLTLEIQDKDNTIAEQQQQLDQLQTDQLDIYEDNIQLQSQISSLKQQLEYYNQQQMIYDSQLTNLNTEELQEQLKKCKMVIQILKQNSEEEKQESLKKLQKYELALQYVPEMQEKIKNNEKILKENQILQQQVQELKDRIDDMGDSYQMIELMTKEVVKKDQQIEQQELQMEEMRQIKDMDQEFIEEYEKINKMLSHDIEQKNLQFKILENRFEEVVQKLTENNMIIDKFKNKCNEKDQQITSMKEQLENKDQDKTYKKIDELSQKVQQQQLENTQIYAKYIENYQQYLQATQEIQVANVYLKKLPKELLEKLNINNFKQYLKVENIIQKTQFIIKEIMDKYLNNPNVQVSLQKWLISCVMYSQDIIYYSEMFMTFVQKNLNNDKFQEIIKRGQVFNQLTSVNVLIMNTIKYLKEESLSNKISLEPYKNYVSKLGESVLSIFRNHEYSMNGVIENQISKYKQLLGKLSLILLQYSFNDINNKSLLDLIIKMQNKAKLFYYKAISKTNLYRECENHNLILPIVDIEAQIEALLDFETFFDQSNQLSEKLVYDKLLSDIQINIIISDKEKEILDYLQSDQYIFEENVTKGPWDENIEQVNKELIKIINQQQEIIIMKEQQKQNEIDQVNWQQIQIENQRIQQELQKRVSELQMKAERAIILEKEKERLTEQQQMFKENEGKLKEQLQTVENKIKEKDDLIAELKENQVVVNEKRGHDDFIDDGECYGESKYYKAICKKLVMDLYKIKQQNITNKFKNLELDHSFQQLAKLKQLRLNKQSQGSSSQQQQTVEEGAGALKRKRAEVRMLMANQKIINLKDLQSTNQTDLNNKITNILNAQNSQFEDIKIQTSQIYNKFYNANVHSEVKPQIQSLLSEKNTKICSINYGATKDPKNINIVLDQNQYSKIKDWLFNLQ